MSIKYLLLLCVIPDVSHPQCLQLLPPLPEVFVYTQSAYIASLSSVYLFGGKHNASIFKWDTNGPVEWIHIGYPPDSNGFYSFANAVATINNLLYFVGLDTSVSSVLIFDASTESWLDTSHIPDAPNGGVDGCVAHNDSHIFFVGSDFSNIGDELQIYDITNNLWSSVPIEIKAVQGNNYWGQYCWMTHNILYVFGGVVNKNRNIGNIYKWEYNNGWSTVGSLPAAMSEGIAAKHPLDNNIWLIGGYDGQWTRDTIYQFNIDTELITNTYYMTTVLQGLAADFIDNDLYTFGGVDVLFNATDVIQICDGLVDVTAPLTTSTTSITTASTDKPTTSPTPIPTNVHTASSMMAATVLYDIGHDVISTGASNPLDKSNTSLINYKYVMTGGIGIGSGVVVVIIGICCYCIYYRNIREKRNTNTITPGRRKPTADILNSNDRKQKNINIIALNDQPNAVFAAWVKHTLGLPQYMDTFVKNGYDNILMLELIEDKSQLIDIGILKRGHQMLIMHEISKLILKRKESVKNVELQILGQRPGEKSVCESEVGEKFTVEGNINTNVRNNSNVYKKEVTIVGGVEC